MNTLLRCISWIAVSSQPQTERESPEEQRQANLKTIQQLGGTLVAELVVPGQSREIIGFDQACEQIAAYAQLRQLIEQRGADLLVCRDRSRLGRTKALIEQVVAYCLQAGIAVYSISMPPQSIDAREQALSEGYTVMGAIESAFAQAEMLKFRKRHEWGMKGRIKRGEFPAQIPFGWKRRYDEHGNHNIILDEQAANIIRYALVELYLTQGRSFVYIANHLNQLGHRTRYGRPWTRAAVRNMLNRVKRYAGIAEINEFSRTGREYVRANGKWPPILTESEAMAIIDERESRVGARRSVNSHRLFSRTAFCERCGGRIVLYMTKDRRYKNKERIGYRCANRCRGSYIYENRMKEALLNAIDFLASKANRDQILVAIPDRSKEIEQRIAYLTAALQDIQRKRNKINHAYIHLGTLKDSEYQALISDIEDQESAICNDLARAQSLLHDVQHEARLEQRLYDISRRGHEIMQGDPAIANAWIRQHFVLYIKNNQVNNIEYK